MHAQWAHRPRRWGAHSELELASQELVCEAIKKVGPRSMYMHAWGHGICTPELRWRVTALASASVQHTCGQVQLLCSIPFKAQICGAALCTAPVCQLQGQPELGLTLLRSVNQARGRMVDMLSCRRGAALQLYHWIAATDGGHKVDMLDNQYVRGYVCVREDLDCCRGQDMRSVPPS